jgi:hydrogenase maturation protease
VSILHILTDVRVLVAGMGNVLRGDDGFGVAVVQALEHECVPEGVRLLDVGIGGIHLVQELQDPFDALIVVDAVDVGRQPGTLITMRPEVRKPAGPDDLADIHYANPERALMLAGALRRLPEDVWLVGVQPEDAERLGDGLSAVVSAAVGPAVAEVRRLLAEL